VDRWPVIDARISELSVPTVGEQGRPFLLYTYEVSGETHYGSATGFNIDDAPKTGFEFGDPRTCANRATVDVTTTLHVRYNPADPMSSLILNQDNPTLPFEIDHDPF